MVLLNVSQDHELVGACTIKTELVPAFDLKIPHNVFSKIENRLKLYQA